MNANECFNSEDSESKSRTGSTGPPKSLSVCDTLSNCTILCFSSGKSILSRESFNHINNNYQGSFKIINASNNIYAGVTNNIMAATIHENKTRLQR